MKGLKEKSMEWKRRWRTTKGVEGVLENEQEERRGEDESDGNREDRGWGIVTE